jgi:hypothetical protein
MSAENDLALAYHMGYDDALAKRKPDASKAQVLAPYDLAAENAKLREELAKARDPQRIGGQADPSSFVYAIEQLREFRWQHATNDEDAIPYINNVAAAHERENAKLREQGARLFDKALELGTENDRLRELVRDMACEYECGYLTLPQWLADRMRELGAEVDE